MGLAEANRGASPAFAWVFITSKYYNSISPSMKNPTDTSDLKLIQPHLRPRLGVLLRSSLAPETAYHSTSPTVPGGCVHLMEA